MNSRQSRLHDKYNGFEVIEWLCASKSSNPDDCEDSLVVNEGYIVVIDGATSKNTARYNGKTGGKIAADIIALCFQNGHLDSCTDYKTGISSIQTELKAYSNARQLEEKGVHLCASAIIYNAFKRQIWSIGDCQFILNGRHHTFHNKIDTVLSEARSIAVHMLLQSGITERDLLKKDLAREFIKDELMMQKYLENTDDEYGYGIFSSQGEVKSYTITEVPPGSEVILASDGYPELYDSLKESEERLDELIRIDPLCYKHFKSTKGLKSGCTHFDDRTYIRFRTGS